MTFRTSKIVNATSSFILIACGLVNAECPVKQVIVKGRVEHSPDGARVHVQLVYPKNRGGDSAEATLQEDGNFNIPIEFLTQSRKPSVNGLFEKCERKPETVVITLIGSNQSQELDRVSIDFIEGFKMDDPSRYSLRSEIVLKGSH
jgi:hypothetical protein